jgi:predicted Ser/Thr protein kinase
MDEVCQRFEIAWKAAAAADQQPRIEDYLPEVPPAERGALVRELLLLDLHYRGRRGDTPSRDDYRQRFQEYGDWIEDLLAATGADGAALQGPQGVSDLHTQPYRMDLLQGSEQAGPDTPDLPGYEVREELGRGGMGVVYQARQVGLNRTVALKMIRPEVVASPEHRACFRAEAETVAQVQHPHIVQIYEIGEGFGSLYFSMEFVDGKSLAEALRNGHWAADRPDGPRRAAQLVALLADAVHHAHQHDIVHRDLKPANVLLAADGTPKITDFGLARRLEDPAGMTQPGAVVGTPSYMAPEQAAGASEQVSRATDVFGLGGILYALLSGQAPHAAATREQSLAQARAGQVAPPRQRNPRVPVALERICLRAMSKQPEDRHGSAAALAEDLRRWLDRPRRLRLWLAGAAAVLLVGLAVGAVVLSRTTAPGQHAEPPRPLQDDRLVLRIWSPDGSKKGLRIGVDPGALPARHGDTIRVEVRLNQPAYIYLMALDAQGEVTPLYPWHRDVTKLDRTVNDPPPRVPAQAELTWPSLESVQGLPLDDSSGLETILLLARRTPLPEGFSLADRVGPLPLPAAPLGHGEEFVLRGVDEGQPDDALRQFDQNRGFQKELGDIDEPLERLLGRLRGDFELLRAARLAHQGR